MVALLSHSLFSNHFLFPAHFLLGAIPIMIRKMGVARMGPWGEFAPVLRERRVTPPTDSTTHWCHGVFPTQVSVHPHLIDGIILCLLVVKVTVTITGRDCTVGWSGMGSLAPLWPILSLWENRYEPKWQQCEHDGRSGGEEKEYTQPPILNVLFQCGLG